MTVDSSGLSAKATELANRLSERIADLDEDTLDRLLTILDAVPPRKTIGVRRVAGRRR